MISIWRYSHLTLAIITSVFLAIASITGVILVFDEIDQKYPDYKTVNSENISVADLLTSLEGKYLEISQISIDHNQFISLEGITLEGDNIVGYIDGKTGEIITKIPKKSTFIQWVTTLHRSLFLHETGRALMGVVSFLLALISLSGMVLVIQRQQGFRHFFSRIGKDKFAPFYHTFWGRWSLVPILIIAVTGMFLSANRFFFTKQEITHNIDFQKETSSIEQKKWRNFAFFQQTPLSDVKSISFPFSQDKEEYFLLKLSFAEVAISQFSGEVLSFIPYTATTCLTQWALALHTGRTHIFWTIILGVACFCILFFIYSGFCITLSRKSVQVKNKFQLQEAEIVILVGTQNGSTLFFANAIHSQLLKQGEKSFLTELNKYLLFPKAKQLLIFTSTYGKGDAPSSGSKFLQLIKNQPQSQIISYSVIGFGSSNYPDFCKFAKEIDTQLSLQQWAKRTLELHTIDKKSSEEFVQWIKKWSEKTGIQLNTSASLYVQKPNKLYKMKVVGKSATDSENIFTLTLQTRKKFVSGDLLAIYPQGKERLYSIGKINNQLQLVVKRHTNGLGSEYLHELKKGDFLLGKIRQNPHFHLPKKPVLLISNGTGIAPFLGMIQNAFSECYLYAGFRRKTPLIADFISFFEAEKQKKKLTNYKIAFSKEIDKCYVTDLLKNDAQFVSKFLEKQGVIIICGSLSMYNDVELLLTEICFSFNQKNLDFYKENQQILSDCY